MTMAGMQIVCMRLRNNKRAQQAILMMTKCLRIAFDAVLLLKQQMTSIIAKTKVQAFDAMESMKKKEKKKHNKSKDKFAFMGQKREDEIEVFKDRIGELKEEAKTREKTMEMMRLKIQNLELSNENLKGKTKYMNRYRTTKTTLDNTIKEKDEAIQRLAKYSKKLADFPSVEKYKKKIEKHTKKIKEQDEKLSVLETDNKKWKAKTKKYVTMVNDKIKESNKRKIEMKKMRAEIEELKKKQVKPEDSESESDEESSDDEDDTPVRSVKPVVTPKYTQKSLNIKSFNELKDLCRSKGIRGYSGKRKELLIAFMLGHKKIV